MSLINIKNLTFAYPGSYDNIFENVSFQLDTAWKLGFTGRNGKGKTTFLKLLLGEYEYEGNIYKSVHFDYFPFQIQDDTQLTSDVVSQIYPDFLQWQLLKELSNLKVNEGVLSRPFNTLSKGEQTKVLLAALFLKENNFLLIDEPTNHLDLEGRRIVSEYLKSKSGFILVCHDRAFLDGCVDHILAINKSDIQVVQGNFSSWYNNKQLQDEFEISENEKLKKEIKRLEQAAKEKAGWSEKLEKTKYDTKNSGLRPDRGYIGHKSAKMMKSSKVIENRGQLALREKSKLLKNIEESEELKIAQLSYPLKQLVYMKNVTINYGEKPVCQHISFTLEKGDRVGVIGANGSGKSSLIKLICGENIAFTGEFEKGSQLKISYVSQDTSFLQGDLKAFALENSLDESLFKAILRKLDFSRMQFEKDMKDFSGGQKKKVLIAKSLCEKSHLLIWDEPLNFIDVISRIQIENLLLSYKPTILFVEHDRAFCENIATKTVRL